MGEVIRFIPPEINFDSETAAMLGVSSTMRLRR